jgi:hypothetical protein
MEPLRRSAMFLGDHNGPISTVAGPLTHDAAHLMDEAFAKYVQTLGNECCRQRELHNREVVQDDDVRQALERISPRERIVHVYSNATRSDWTFLYGGAVGALLSSLLWMLL